MQCDGHWAPELLRFFLLKVRYFRNWRRIYQIVKIRCRWLQSSTAILLVVGKVQTAKKKKMRSEINLQSRSLNILAARIHRYFIGHVKSSVIRIQFKIILKNL